jgi:uncharacterized membrane protein YkoI
MDRWFALSVVAAVGSVVATPFAHARDALLSSPFHRCVVAALAVKPGEVVEVEKETEGGRPVYEIEILGSDGNRWEAPCHMTSIRILKVELDNDDDNTPTTRPHSLMEPQSAEPPAAVPGVQAAKPRPVFKVTEEKAKQIALGQYPGVITRVVQEYSDGRPGYEIHIRSARGTRIEVEIDGVSGEVMEVSEKPR